MKIVQRVKQRRLGANFGVYVAPDGKEVGICEHVLGSLVYYLDLRELGSDRRTPKIENRGKIEEPT